MSKRYRISHLGRLEQCESNDDLLNLRKRKRPLTFEELLIVYLSILLLLAAAVLAYNGGQL